MRFVITCAAGIVRHDESSHVSPRGMRSWESTASLATEAIDKSAQFSDRIDDAHRVSDFTSVVKVSGANTLEGTTAGMGTGSMHDLSIGVHGSLREHLSLTNEASAASFYRRRFTICLGTVSSRTPTAGDLTYVDPGKDLTGSNNISDNVPIGANTVVSAELNRLTVVAATPARMASGVGSPTVISDLMHFIHQDQDDPCSTIRSC